MKITQTGNTLDSKIDAINRELAKVPAKAYKEFVKNTPIRTGNARSQTRLRQNVIHADYPYAQPLDNGYSSQSPDGMTEPTIKYIRTLVSNILRKI
jgi:hypothetical protein